MPPLFNIAELLPSAADKAKLIAKSFPRNSNLDGWSISLPVLSSTTYRKLHNISVTPKLITTYQLNPSVCVWRNLVFQILGRSYQWSLYLVMLVKDVHLKTTNLLLFFPRLIKSENLVSNRLVDYVEKCDLFSHFQYGFRSYHSPADTLTVASKSIT